MLSKMFGDDWDSQRDINGCYLIDRTPGINFILKKVII